MIEIPREVFKTDWVFRRVWEEIKKIHKVAPHDEKLLYQNRHVKDFCVESRYFMVMPGKNTMYLHYDTASWYGGKKGALVKIEKIVFYDDFLEYETNRMRLLHGSKDSEIPNIN